MKIKVRFFLINIGYDFFVLYKQVYYSSRNKVYKELEVYSTKYIQAKVNHVKCELLMVVIDSALSF